MVLGSIKNASTYLSLHSRFKHAFEFIQNNDLTNMEPGKFVLDGENLYLSLVETQGKKPENAQIETHKRYIDIQVVLEGQETMGWAAIDRDSQEIDPYNAENDITFYKNKPTTFITLHPGEFAIFFPEDGHAPLIGNGPIKKAIVKVLI